MSNLDQILKSRQAADLLKNTEKLEELRDAPETKKLFAMLSKSTGGNLEQTAQGDSERLIAAIRQLTQDPEGARLIRQMQEKLK